jgi:excisionase family DNA binding protein
MARNRDEDTLKRIRQAFRAHRRALDELEEALLEGFGSQSRDDHQLLSVPQVARELNVGRSWVYQQIKAGQIPSVQLGGNLRVAREDLDDYIQRRRYSPQEEDE